jgi:hypothetical protein
VCECDGQSEHDEGLEYQWHCNNRDFQRIIDDVRSLLLIWVVEKATEKASRHVRQCHERKMSSFWRVTLHAEYDQQSK